MDAPRDAASIMGVPEAELTPNVQRALLSLMGEVDQLRKDTERLRGRVRELESWSLTKTLSRCLVASAAL